MISYRICLSLIYQLAKCPQVPSMLSQMSGYPSFSWLNNFCCYCSVTESCPTLCNPTDCSMLGFPVLHYLPEFAQIHVHWVSEAIQPSHSLLPLLLLTSIFPSIRAFSSESALRIRWPKYWSFNISISPFSEYSGLISFRIDQLDLPAVLGSPDSQEAFPAPQFKSINSSAFSLLYDSTLRSIYEYWKNHSFDSTDLCQQSDVSALGLS